MHGLLLIASFLFSDIPWKTPVPQVKAQLAAAGFTGIRKIDRGDLGFHGKLLNREAAGKAIFSRGKLVKVVVMVSGSEDSVRQNYKQLRDAFVAQYGQPSQTVASILEPFHEGDGYEAEAIREGRGIFATQWASDGEKLTVNITPEMFVAVTWESSEQLN